MMPPAWTTTPGPVLALSLVSIPMIVADWPYRGGGGDELVALAKMHEELRYRPFPVRPAWGRRAAYAFFAGGHACKPSFSASMLTSIALLLRLKPAFPVVALLGGACWVDPHLLTSLRALNVRIVRAPPLLDNVTCVGTPLGPDGSQTVGQGYFAGSYGVLGIWSLSEYDAVLYLDRWTLRGGLCCGVPHKQHCTNSVPPQASASHD